MDPVDLRRRAMRGGAALAAGQLLRGAIQFGGLVLLARLLPPSDVGVVVMATALIGVASVLSDFGLSMSIMREKELEHRIRDQILYLNVALAATIAACVWALAPFVASFYSEPKLVSVTHWLALSTFMMSLAPQFRAELARQMRYRWLATVDVLSQATGLAVAVAAAILGAGYWAVVYQQLCAATCLLGVLVAASRYVPRSRLDLRGVRAHLQLGATTLAAQATNYVAVNSAPAAVGRALGASAVGVYSRAFQLASIPLVQLASPLTRVAVPMLAHTRNDADLVTMVRRVQLLLAFTLMPLLVLLGVGGAPLVEVLFGSAWVEGGETLQILAVGGLFQVAGYAFFWLFIQKGRLATLWLCELAVWAVLVPLFFAAAEWGQDAVAGLYALGLMANWLLVGTAGCRRIGIVVGELMLPSLHRLSCFGVLMALGTLAREITEHATQTSAFVVVLVSFVSSGVGGVFLLAISKFREEVVEVFDMVRDVLGSPTNRNGDHSKTRTAC